MDRRTTDNVARDNVSGAVDSWPLCARDAATAIGVCERTVRRAINRGELAAIKQHGVYRISAGDIAEYQAHHQRSPPLESVVPPEPKRQPEPNINGLSTLPVALSPLIGREREIAHVIDLLRRDNRPDLTRLLTLTGPGGVGKTRLAVQVAEATAADFPGGIWFVSLAPISDPALATLAIAHVLGVRETSGEFLLDRVAAFLADRRSLLVLDNFEQIVVEAPLVAALLQRCPQLTVLVTSRMRLRVSGEHEHVVPPLDVTARDIDVPTIDASQSEAVRLFAARARAVHEDFDLSDDNSGIIADICRRLDGLPLAIELAAARVKVLSPAALLKRLDQRLPLLTGGGRDLPVRQQTMRDTIAWSHDLLTAAEQVLFRRLAVFAGGCTLAAAEAICGAADSESDDEVDGASLSVFDGITSLVDKSLLRQDAGPANSGNSESRYLMLETVREYAHDRLETSGEAEIIRERHATYFAERAKQIAPLLQWQPDTATSVLRLDAEQDNLWTALVWSSNGGAQPVFLRLAVALQSYWVVRARLREGGAWLDRAVALCSTAPLPVRAAVLGAAGWMARFQGHYEEAERRCREGLELARENGDALAIAHALTGLGFIAEDCGEFARSRTLHEEALAMGRRVGASAWIAWSTRNIGNQALLSGDYASAEHWLGEALALFELQGHVYGAAHTMSNLAAIALARGEYARAAQLWRPRLGLTWDTCGLRISLECIAGIALACREWELAARLFGSAAAHRDRLGVTVRPRQLAEYERMVAALRAELDEATFLAAWDAGHRMSPDAARITATQFADRIKARAIQVVKTSDVGFCLTKREFEILRMVTRGDSNRDIATALFISIPTVKRHLTNILGKLGVTSRSAAADLARTRGLC